MNFKSFKDTSGKEIFFNIDNIQYFTRNHYNQNITDVYMGDNKIITIKSDIENFIKEITVNKNLLKG